MLTTSLRWLGNLATTDPFERRSAMTVQAFCIGLTLLTALDTIIDQVRGAGVAHSLPEITTALFSMLAVLLIRRGRIRAGYALALGGYIGILSLSLVLRGLEYHREFLVRVFTVLLVFPALLLGRRALWTTMGVMLAAMLVGHLRDLGFLGVNVPAPQSVGPPLGIWGQAVAVMLLLGLVLDRFGSALTEAYAAAIGRQREAERVSEELRIAKESLESEMERRVEAEARFYQAQKLEAVGRLSGGVAHDFNNLLTAILGYAELSRDSLAPEDPRRRYIEGLIQAANRGAGLTRQLLAFARRQIVEPRAIHMEDRVRALRGMLDRLIGESVHIELALAPEPPTVMIDPVQFEQVLVNLAVNARDAMPHGGTLRIETGRFVVPPGPEEGARGLEPGEHARMLVSDTGEGMDAVTLTSIFEPFFTTKESGAGTGLGLATCYGIIRQARGSITATSTPGQGTSFEILLPVTSQAPDPDRAATRSVAARGTEAILVVEDDPQVLDLVTRVLLSQGYRVRTASNADVAEEVVRNHPDETDLLLTDVVLPGTDGRRLAVALARLQPTLATLFMSGYSDEVIARHRVLDPGLALLAKPFTPETLLHRVRDVLDARIVTPRA